MLFRDKSTITAGRTAVCSCRGAAGRLKSTHHVGGSDGNIIPEKILWRLHWTGVGLKSSSHNVRLVTTSGLLLKHFSVVALCFPLLCFSFSFDFFLGER